MGVLSAAVAIGVLAALGTGVWIDAMREPTQPILFWCFLAFGLGGTALGVALRARADRSPLRRLLAAAAALFVWRVSHFPLMVICGWQASIGEFLVHAAFGRSVVYPTFLALLFVVHLAIAAVAAAAILVPEGSAARGRFQPLRDVLHRPPRALLWAAGALLLPVAILVSFSKPSDLVLLGDGPWREARPIPPIHDPEINAYAEVMREHHLSFPAWVLAANGALTYPLVPEGPWGGAMKGTLEALTLARPLATSRDRLDEHYLAYLAAHRRLHEADGS